MDSALEAMLENPTVQCNLTPSPKAGLSLESLHQLK